MLGGLALLAIPSLMVFLSLALPARVARWLNLAVAALYIVVSIANSVGETWAFFWLGSTVEAALLLLVIRYAWTWPRRSTETAPADLS